MYSARSRLSTRRKERKMRARLADAIGPETTCNSLQAFDPSVDFY